MHSHVWEGLEREEKEWWDGKIFIRGNHFAKGWETREVGDTMRTGYVCMVWEVRGSATDDLWGFRGMTVFLWEPINTVTLSLVRNTLWLAIWCWWTKGLKGINKTAGSLNNVRQQFKQDYRHISWRLCEIRPRMNSYNWWRDVCALVNAAGV